MKNHNNQKKIALINDLSGFGRCSIAVELPIISTMKVQCCPLPTSILTNHTGFDSFFFDDYTEKMPHFKEEWEKLGLKFNGICTGFLGSKKQIDLVIDFIRCFKKKNTCVIIDPVMGDYGALYPTYSAATCKRMRKLLPYADILTPNLTEACILTDTPYKEKWKKKELIALAGALSLKGPKKVVITGIPQGKFIANLCYEAGKEAHFLRTFKVGTQRSGTSDIFCAIIAADAVNGVAFAASVKKASRFVKNCIRRSIELEIPLTDGVCFEELLHTLR